jgi:hypothetical protein
LKEVHIQEAISDWLKSRGSYVIDTNKITWEYEDRGQSYEPDLVFIGAKVELPLGIIHHHPFQLTPTFGWVS